MNKTQTRILIHSSMKEIESPCSQGAGKGRQTDKRVGAQSVTGAERGLRAGNNKTKMKTCLGLCPSGGGIQEKYHNGVCV